VVEEVEGLDGEASAGQEAAQVADAEGGCCEGVEVGIVAGGELDSAVDEVHVGHAAIVEEHGVGDDLVVGAGVLGHALLRAGEALEVHVVVADDDAVDG
jgi:hypothetical protein